MNAVLTFYNLLFISAYSFLLFIVFLHINSYNLKRFHAKKAFFRPKSHGLEY